MLRLFTVFAFVLSLGGAVVRADDPPSQKEINATNYQIVAAGCRDAALVNWNKADAAFKTLELVVADLEADYFANQKAVEDGCTPEEWDALNKNLTWCYDHRDKGAGLYVAAMESWAQCDEDWTDGMGAFAAQEWDTARDWFVSVEFYANAAAGGIGDPIGFDGAEREWTAALDHARLAYAIVAKYRVRAGTR